MGRYDNNLKCAELRKLLGERKYKQAFQVLQEIDVDKVRLVTDLNAFAEIYRKAGKYEKAREMLLRVYEKSPSKRVIYKLACIAILEKNFEDAEGYYEDYMKEDPESEERYVIRYRIDKARQLGYDVRIKDLEALKEYEYIEEWGFELAKLYHKAGMAEKCVEECNDIILWFGEGVIVEKARMLRSYYLDGNRVLGSYGSNLERARERAMKQEERAKSMKMDTSELSEQIEEYTKEDHYREIKKELEDELKPTMDLQEAMKRDLGLSDTGNVQEEISRIIEEQERKEIEAEEEEENSGWIFNIGRKGKKGAGQEREKSAEKPNESEEMISEKRSDTGEIFQKLQRKIERVEEDNFGKGEREDWELSRHEEGQILSLQQSLENSLGRSVAEIVEEETETGGAEPESELEHTARIDDIGRERLTLLRKSEEAGQNGEAHYGRSRKERSRRAAENGAGQDERADYVGVQYDEGQDERADYVGVQYGGGQDERADYADVQHDEEQDGRADYSSMQDDAYDDMIIPKKGLDDSSVIPLEEIKQALRGMRSKTRTPGFEKIEPEELNTGFSEKSRSADSFEDAPRPVEIQIHYGERYQDFVNEEEYRNAMEEQNSRNKDLALDADDDLPSMEEVEKYRNEMDEEACIIAGINLPEIFQSFMQYSNIKKQLVDIFKKIEEKNIKACNFVVVGDSKSGKTTLGKLIAKAMMERGIIPSKSIAKIRSDKFNQMNFEKHKSDLKDRCLIVEHAGGMYVPTIKNLQEVMDDYSGHIVVILEDSQGSMERLFLENYQLNSYFEFTIRL